MRTTPQRRGQLVHVESIRPGDAIEFDGGFEMVTAVQRARGRKPAVGENLLLVTDRGVVKANSTTGIRVRR